MLFVENENKLFKLLNSLPFFIKLLRLNTEYIEDINTL